MTCHRGDKLRYRNRKFAAMVAAQVRIRTAEHITAYHCRPCHCWHIGHEYKEPSMAAMSPKTVACPVCQGDIEIPFSLSTERGTDGDLIVTLTPDVEPIKAHADLHAD